MALDQEAPDFSRGRLHPTRIEQGRSLRPFSQPPPGQGDAGSLALETFAATRILSLIQKSPANP